MTKNTQKILIKNIKLKKLKYNLSIHFEKNPDRNRLWK